MAGDLKVNQIQIGDSGTSDNNLVIKTNIDGTFSISRGSIGGALTPILSIDADGKMVSAWEKAAGQQSLATANGYQKLSNGLILQWGEYPGGAHQPTITFPIAFPNACHMVSTTGATDNDSVAVNSKSTTQFVASQLDQAGATSTNATTGFYWFAIGY
jgi:hypothetical protein